MREMDQQQEVALQVGELLLGDSEPALSVS